MSAVLLSLGTLLTIGTVIAAPREASIVMPIATMLAAIWFKLP